MRWHAKLHVTYAAINSLNDSRGDEEEEEGRARPAVCRLRCRLLHRSLQRESSLPLFLSLLVRVCFLSCRYLCCKPAAAAFFFSQISGIALTIV
jgi:hypothetical protein